MGQNRPLFPMLNSRLRTVGYANKAKHGCVDWQLSDSMKIFTRIKDNCRMLLNPRAKREETEKTKSRCFETRRFEIRAPFLF